MTCSLRASSGTDGCCRHVTHRSSCSRSRMMSCLIRVALRSHIHPAFGGTHTLRLPLAPMHAHLAADELLLLTLLLLLSYSWQSSRRRPLVFLCSLLPHCIVRAQTIGRCLNRAYTKKLNAFPSALSLPSKHLRLCPEHPPGGVPVTDEYGVHLVSRVPEGCDGTLRRRWSSFPFLRVAKWDRYQEHGVERAHFASNWYFKAVSCEKWPRKKQYMGSINLPFRLCSNVWLQLERYSDNPLEKGRLYKGGRKHTQKLVKNRTDHWQCSNVRP